MDNPQTNTPQSPTSHAVRFMESVEAKFVRAKTIEQGKAAVLKYRALGLIRFSGK